MTEDGRLLLATGSDDETVRVWDPVGGSPLGPPVTGHEGPVTSVAFGATVDRGLLMATGSWKVAWPLAGDNSSQ